MSKQKILVIEDNPLNMELVKRLLSKADFELFMADNAETGIEIAQKEQPDLILMDISLPGMDGLTATQHLKSDPETINIPIVALTAHVMKGDKEKALAAGCDGYMPKPIDTQSFVQEVSSYIK